MIDKSMDQKKQADGPIGQIYEDVDKQTLSGLLDLEALPALPAPPSPPRLSICQLLRYPSRSQRS